MDWLDKKAMAAYGRSTCKGCTNRPWINQQMCDICTKAYVKGYKACYRAEHKKRKE